ncbi:MAG: PD40 domain-containing protein [Leptospiraceae bacterium]|nr:PD40 domain-containing protein [Leptospiraceae bacterium]
MKLLLLLFTLNCSLLTYRISELKQNEFQYDNISKAHFTHNNENPFPLTVRRGNNIYNSITKDGRYLFFASDSSGNFDIFLRDLQSSVVLPITSHPAPQYKPAISPDGKKLAIVSERYDSEGDIVVIKINPEEMVKSLLSGTYEIQNYKQDVITNPLHEDFSKIERVMDSDPNWSPDGRYIAFTSRRFGGKVPNIGIIDTENKNSIKQITQNGGATPYFAPDGKKIYFISFKDEPTGEVYSIDIATKEEKRITFDKYMDFSPSLSTDGEYLYYTSIREDSNKNKKLDELDNSFIIRKNLKSEESIAITAGNLSIFDTKYSSLNGGSIVFSASLDNALNIYFIPKVGEIPKQENITKQYDLAKLYKNRSMSYFKLALNSIYLHFGNDPLYPLYRSRADKQLVEDYLDDGDDREAEILLEEMLKTKGDKTKGLSYALAIHQKAILKNTDPVPELKSYYEYMKEIQGVHSELPPSILILIGNHYRDIDNYVLAEQMYERIRKEYPKYYRITEVKQKEGLFEYKLNPNKIPNSFIEIVNNPESTRDDKKYIMNDIVKVLGGQDNLDKKSKLIESYLKDQNLEVVCPELAGLIKYTRAVIYNEQDKFEDSNRLVESYLPSIKVGSYVYLKSKLLQADNFKDIGADEKSNEELVAFVKNYDYFSGVEITEDEIENSFFYFETRAREYERKGKLKKSIQNFIYNNLLLSLAIERKLPIQKTYKDYSVFYQKMMVDNSFKHSDLRTEKNSNAILNKFNLLGRRQLDVAGKLTESLAYFFRWKYFRIFGDFRDLQYITPLESESFSQMKDFFQERSDIARKSLDYATIYGYAYYLVSKAVTEETFHINEQTLTYARKKGILQDLKQAENDLQWIIYANPQYTDAYLLLGWLYQYIDVRKNTFTFPENERDSEVFEKLYVKFFPYKYLEENIELYSQILQFLGTKYENKKALSDLHLNLANNYFLLSNYPKALQEYQEVEKYSKFILEKNRFENYRQKAVYYFNLARVNVYNGKTRESINHLKTVLEIYYKHEYFPLIAKIGTKQIPELTNYLEDVKKKIALLNALLGLAQMELEMYSEAIQSFSNAVSMNGESDYINDISLYNSLAYCYQHIGDYKKSEESLVFADKEYNRKKKTLSELLSVSLNEKFWNYALPDSARVQGEGRFPGKIPLDFENLITKGIRITNNVDKNEFDEVINLLEERTKFIKNKGLDNTIVGEKILESTLNELGLNEYSRGNYHEAAKIFMKEYGELKKKGDRKKAFQAYIKSDISLYSHIEQNSEKAVVLIQELNENIKFLNKFKEEETNFCLKNYQFESGLVNNQKEEICREKFYSDYYNYDPYMGNNYFYLGEIYLSKKEYEKAFINYGVALSLFKNPSGIKDDEIGLEKDHFKNKERTRLKIMTAIVYLRLGEKEKFEKTLKESFYLANEFQLERELIVYYILASEYNFRNGKYKESLDFSSKAENVLKTSPGLWYDIDEITINYIYSLKSLNLIKLKNYNQLSINREKLFSSIFFRQLIINELRFQDKEVFKTINSLQLSVWEDREFIYNIENANLNQKDPKDLVKAKAKNQELITRDLNLLTKFLPKGMDALSWYAEPKKFEPKLRKDELLIEYFGNGTEGVQKIFFENRSEFQEYQLSGKNDTDTIAKNIEEVLIRNPQVKKIVIIPSPFMYNINFRKLSFLGKTLNDNFEIRHLFRLSQLEREADTDFSRLKRITSVIPDAKVNVQQGFNLNPINLVLPKVEPKKDPKELNLRIISSNELKNYLTDTDILEGPTDFANRKHYIGEKKSGSINIKEVVEDQWTIPFLILTNYSSSMDNYMKAGFLYDILQFAGVQSIILLEPTAENAKVRDNLISNTKNANRIIKEEKLHLVGEYINEYPDNQKIYEGEFRRYTAMAIKEERKRNYLQSMKFLLQANSVLPDNNVKYLIQSEVNLAKLKTKVFPNLENYLIHYENLLNRFAIDSKEEEEITYELLLSCYDATIDVDCEKYQTKYNSISNATENRKFITNYYKNLRIGNLKVVDLDYNKFISTDSNEDPYLKNMKLALLFSRGFMWEQAKLHAELAKKLAESEKEIGFAETVISDIQYEILFIKGIDPDIIKDDKVFYYATNRIWDAYRKKAKEISGEESEITRKNYQTRLLDALDSIENRADFEPTSLGPLYLKDGRPALYLLKESDRNFLFYLLLKSMVTQTGEELNNQFDLLIDTELRLKNRNRALWMQIQWAGALYHRGDYENAKKYYQDFDGNFKDYYPEKNLVKTFYTLKYKLSRVFPDIQFSDSERNIIKDEFKEWFGYYELSEKQDSKEFIKTLNKLIAAKKKEKLDIFNSRELDDFISFLQLEAVEKKDYATFTDLGFTRDKFKSVNDKVFGRGILFSDLPEAKQISKELLVKIPKSQVFTAVIDLGIKSYVVKMKEGLITTELGFADNRNIKSAILDYYYTIKDGGVAIVKQESIEARYKEILKFAKNAVHYIYLPSFHFKAVIEPEEQDYFYYVLSPELLLERPVYDSSQNFLPGFKVEAMNTSNYAAKWWKMVLDLEKYEIRNVSGSGGGNKVIVSQEDLQLDKGKKLEYGGIGLNDLKRIDKRKGVWVMTGNLLSEASIQNDDFAYSLRYIDQIHQGPGVVFAGTHNSTTNAYFIKKFCKNLNYRYPFVERYYDAFTQTQKEFDFDRNWNGYKPYTNMFLK